MAITEMNFYNNGGSSNGILQRASHNGSSLVQQDYLFFYIALPIREKVGGSGCKTTKVGGSICKSWFSDCGPPLTQQNKLTLIPYPMYRQPGDDFHCWT